MNAAHPPHSPLPDSIQNWFHDKGWIIRQHQQHMADAMANGDHALLVADTGAGKTLAGFLPILAMAARGELQEEQLYALYISPLKALTHDVARNVTRPAEEIGLNISIETRTGDTPSQRKSRQRRKPPHILMTTPELLSLLLSWPESETLFASLRYVVIDEIHSFANGKRGDLLALALTRLQKLAPQMQRIALSATIAEPESYRQWLSPNGMADNVRLIKGEKGAPPQISIMLPEGVIPWSGHSGHYALDKVMAEISQNRTTIIFCNTRFLAEFIFQKLWEMNEDNLPIGLHHGSLAAETRRKAENFMAQGKLRALVATASLDLGVDWGDIDCVIQMGAPKGSSRLLQRIGRANHRLDSPSRAILVPGNRFEFLEASAALDAVNDSVNDAEEFRPGAIDVLAQHILAMACAGEFSKTELYAEIGQCQSYQWMTMAQFERVIAFVQNGGHALKAYDKYQRLVEISPGQYRLAHPRFTVQYRLNAGIIVDPPMLQLRFKNGRKLGRVEENFAASLAPGDCFHFAGQALEMVAIKELDMFVTPAKKAATIPSFMGARMPLTTHLAARVRGFLSNSAAWARFPDDVREWLEMQKWRSALPQPHQLLAESFPHKNLHYCVIYPFDGWNVHQSLGMLMTKRMEKIGLQPVGFVANDYALGVYGLQPIMDVAPLLSPDILQDELTHWISESYLLKRAFREVAIISGLVERHHPGKRKSGRQVTFSTDLIYDVLQKYEPDHLLLEAAWADARTRLSDVGRLGDCLDNAQGNIVHKYLDRVSPLAVPLLTMLGRENISSQSTEMALLQEAAWQDQQETLAALAMRPD